MSDVFSQPDDTREIRSSDVQTSLGESLSAQAGDAFMGGFNTIGKSFGYFAANHDDAISGGEPSWWYQPQPDVSIDDAKARVKQAGLDGYMKLPDQDTIRAPVLNLMMQDAQEKAQYSAAVDRGPQGFLPGALGFMTQVGAGMADPVNAAAFSIPVLGEARYGKLLASAGESILGRTAVRAGVGLAQGAVGGAAFVPADWWLHTQDGQDYTMADALKSVVMSAGMGAAFHAGGGALGDLYARTRGRPLPGSIEDLQQRAIAGDTHAAEIVEQLGSAGTHLPEAALSDDGVATDQVPGVSASEDKQSAQINESANPETLPPHPAEVIADLPQSAQEDLVHATAADLFNGEPARAGELLQEAAKEDPRIAETVDAWQAGGRSAPAAADEAPTIGERAEAPAAAAKGPKGKDPSNYSLLEFLASQGGIRSDDPLIGDLRGSVGKNKNVPGFGNLIKSPKDLSTAARRGGVKAPMTLDRAREAAVEAGYLRDNGEDAGGEGKSTIGDLLEAVDRESRGDPVYREGVAPPERAVDPAEVAAHRAELEGHIDDLMKDWGVTSLQKFIKRRALGYLDEGHETDPETALERAVTDFEKGPNDQAAAAGAGTDKADWNKLAARRPDDTDLADASREADKTEPPTSAETPAKSVSAAEAAAGAADKLLADILPKLSDDERKTFEDKLAELADDRTAREQIVRDGAACLAAAGLEEAA